MTITLDRASYERIVARVRELEAERDQLRAQVANAEADYREECDVAEHADERAAYAETRATEAEGQRRRAGHDAKRTTLARERFCCRGRCEEAGRCECGAQKGRESA